MINAITAAGNTAAQANNCPRDISGSGQLSEGQSCNVICPVTYNNVGFFTCSLGEVLGESACVAKDGSDVQVAEVTMVASTLEATLDAGTQTNQSLWAASFSQALGDVLGASLSVDGKSVQMARVYIVKASNTSQVVSKSRRLVAELFHIRYEAVILAAGTSSTMADTARIVSQRASALANGASSEQSSLITKVAANGVQVSGIKLIALPRTYQTSVPVDASGNVLKFTSLPAPVPYYATGGTAAGGPVVKGETKSADVGALVGGIIGGMIGLFCIGSLCAGWCYMRKRLMES